MDSSVFNSCTLPSRHLECWRHFVLACRILSQHELSFTQLDLADALLVQFCIKVESLYGRGAITPNMHLHGHLKQVILNFLPICQSLTVNSVVGSILETLTNHNHFKLPTKSKRAILAPHEVDMLKEHYMKLHPAHTSESVIIIS